MNKIFKVIYSKTRHCYVVVSELAKSHCKTAGSHTARNKTALTAAVLLALGTFPFTAVPTVQATDSLFSNDYVGTNYKKDDNSSYLASETKNYHGAGAEGLGSNTLGMNAIAGKNTVTIGDRNASAATESVYIGWKYDATNQMHPDSGKNVVAVGYNSDAAGTGSIAIGSGAAADTFDNAGSGKNPDNDSKSIAIGYNANAKQNNIAIGAGSIATDKASTTAAAFTNQEASKSYVSVGDGTKGSDTQYRRISNVADGAADSDVATVSQLKKAVEATDASKKANIDASNIGKNLKFKADGKTTADSDDITTNEDAWGNAIGTGKVKDNNGQLVTGGTVFNALQEQKNDLTGQLSVTAGWGINIDKANGNTISLKRNLGTNYGNLGWGEGKVTFEASGQNSLILGGAASVSEYDHHSNVKAGAYGKDSVLVGGFNNLIGEKGETSVLVGGQENQVTNQESVIVGGFWNKVTGSNSVVVGGVSNEASGSGDGVFGGFRNKVSGMESVVLGGQTNEVTGMNSVVSGGANNKVSGHYASANGGEQNTISGNYAATLGGFNNQSKGMFSNAIGGDNNITSGQFSITSGGSGNTASGDNSYIGGGGSNQAAGVGASVFGGYRSKVNGILSTGVGGGSTNNKAIAALAAGYQSMVTDGGVAYRSLTSEEESKIDKGQQYWPGFSGILVDNDTKVLDRISTAIGYQATADAPGVISFGHDKGDESSENGSYSSAYYNRLVKAADGIEDHDAVVMEQLKNASDVGSNIKVYKTDENGNVLFDKDNKPIEDTSAKAKRDAAQKASEDAWGTAIGTGKVEAKNSQLVTGDTVYNAIQDKAAWKLTTNGEAADKAATIKPGTTVDFSADKNTENHSNVTISHAGSNVTIGLDKDIVLGDTTHGNGGSLNVYSDSSDSNNLSNHVSINGSTISVNYKNKAGSDTRGVILGVGEDDSKPDGYIAFNNVEGGYTYLHASTDASDDKKGRLEYVGNDGNKKYIANLDDVSTAVNNAKTKYYAVNGDAPLMNLDAYKNDGNDGAKGMGSMAAGFVTHADGIASTVAGSYSGVINQNGNGGLDFRGAAALSYGTFNVNQNTDAAKDYSGVANSIVGQANMTKDSNAAIIYGAGNTVMNSYRDIDTEKMSSITGSLSNPEALSKALQDAVPTSGGQVMVMGGGNSVDNAYMTQVVGVGNTVKGNQVQNTKGEWVTDTSNTAIKDYDKDKSSQYNYVDGFNNEVINGKHDYIIGANNTITGDSYDDTTVLPIKRSNKSNIVIGDNHTLTREQNTVIIGSSDTANTITRARDAVIIGHNANATSDTGADNAVAIGRSATAAGGNAVTIGVNTSAGANSITIGSESSAISGSNIAIGRYARVDGYKVTNAVALGQSAKALVTDGVAIGSGSQATVKGNSVEGYDPATGTASTAATAAWKATKAAVSIGTADGKVTRQINGVAAGTNDTDAANVAQLKKLEGMKANVDATNIGKNLKGADGKTASTEEITANENAWGTAIGTGSIAKDNGQLVTGGTVYAYNKPVVADGKTLNYISESNTTGQNLSALDAQVKTNADNIGTNTTDITKLKNLSNITNEGKNVIKNLAKGSIGMEDGSHTTVSQRDVNGVETYKVDVTVDGQVVKDNTGIVNGGTVYSALQDAQTQINGNLAGKANVDASNIGANLKGTDGKTAASDAEKTTNENAWGTAIGTGSITAENGQLVTGNTVYTYNKPVAPEGEKLNYISETKTTGQNLSALDAQVKTNADNIGTNTTDITKLKNLSNITNEGKNVIKNLAKGSIGMEDGSHTTVSQRDVNGVETYKVDVTVDGQVVKDNTGIVNGGTVYSALQDAQTQINGNLAGKANVDASNIGANLKGTDGKTAASDAEKTTNENAWGTAIGTGSITAENGQLVTGNTVYAYNKPVAAEGEKLNYISETKTTGQNLTALDTQVKSNAGNIGTNTTNISNLQNGEGFTDKGNTYIKNLAKGSIGMENGSHTTVSHRDVNGVETYKVDVKVDGEVKSGNKGIVDGGTVYNAIQDVKNQTNADLANKANVDASNLSSDNVKSWQEKLGNGQVRADNKGLVTGDTVFQAVDTKANRDGSNLTADEAGKFSEKIAVGKVESGDKHAVSGDAVSQAISKVTGNMNTQLEGKANTSLNNITKDGETVIKKLSQDAVQVEAGDRITVKEATNKETGNKTYTISANNNGTVAKDDGNLISGDTLYNEVHVEKDGSYIKSGNTVGQNLSSLDTGLKTTSDLIHTNDKGDTIQIGGNSTATKIDVSGKDANGNTTGRVITGVVSDANDPNSAANVGYVNGLTAANTQQIYRDMNNAYSRLDTNINRAAAGSNALAALHPLDFDPADKASFAVGYGHYHNANAAAVGAFYQPNANTMVNMGISLGNGDPGFNAGVSFKIGKGSAYNGVSKAEMAQTIHDQAAEISAIKANDAAKDKRIDALEKENQEMKKQIQEILARLNG